MMNAFIQEHDLFPAALPFHTGRLLRDGHDYILKNAETFWDQFCFCMAVLVLALRRHTAAFSTNRFHCVLFDQRGSGQSRPFASIDSTPQNY